MNRPASRRGRIAVLGAVVGAVSLLVTACSGGSGGNDGDQVSIGSLLGIPNPKDIDYASQQDRIEEALAECMAKEGWEYIPVHYDFLDAAAVESSDEDEVARIKREGLGVAYYLLNDGIVEDGTSSVNPNDAYVATLSEDETLAYQDSLAGTAEEQAATMTTTKAFDPYQGTTSELSGSHSGCQGEANDAVLGTQPAQSPEDITAMKRFYQEVEARVAADPRTIKLEAGWVSCMKALGYDYASREDFQMATYAEFSAKASAVTGASVGSDPTLGWTQDQIDEFWATSTPEEIDALYNAKPELTAGQRTALEAILEEEVAVGLQEHECSKDMNDKTAAIRADVESQYAIEHEDELTALAASLAAGK